MCYDYYITAIWSVILIITLKIFLTTRVKQTFIFGKWPPKPIDRYVRKILVMSSFFNEAFILRSSSLTHDNVITRLLIFQSQGVCLQRLQYYPVAKTMDLKVEMSVILCNTTRSCKQILSCWISNICKRFSRIINQCSKLNRNRESYHC